MTDHRSDDLTPDPLDHASTESSDWPDDYVEAVFVTRAQSSRAAPARDPHDLGTLFSQWSWEAGYSDWQSGLRALARVLRGLERLGLIERHNLRHPGGRTHHGFILTDDGREALTLLSGDGTEGADR